MYKRFLVSAFLLICVLSFVSCKKSSGGVSSGESIEDAVSGILSIDDDKLLLKGLEDVDLPELTGTDLIYISPEEDAKTVSDERIGSRSALLICKDTNEVVYEKNVYEKIAPASLTKIVTGLLTSDIVNDEIISVPRGIDPGLAFAQKIGFEPGDKLRMSDLYTSMLVFSANDSANAMAILKSGSIPAFVELMNATAAKMGAVRTHFTNPHGLDDPNHYTCLYDLYIFFEKCLKNETFVTTAGKPAAKIGFERGGEHKEIKIRSTNHFLNGEAAISDKIDVICSKTGFTDNAGACLAMAFKNSKGKTFVCISMGNEDKDVLYSEFSKLIDMADK